MAVPRLPAGFLPLQGRPAGRRMCFLPLLLLPLSLLLLQPWPRALLHRFLPLVPLSSGQTAAADASWDLWAAAAAGQSCISKSRQLLGNNKAFEDFSEVLRSLCHSALLGASLPADFCPQLPRARCSCSSRSSIVRGRWRCQGTTSQPVIFGTVQC